jgi:monoamine oxidase
MEAMNDEEIMESAHQVLRGIYGDQAPRAEQAIVTRWASDPFARGSFSYLAVGATPEDRMALAEPVEDRIFFAGEATSPPYAATTHGAYLSGLRAAEEVAAAAGG